ncbi:cylicin-1-like isoform X7 [Hibiscus syriacus]|uniref:cylicin-1-like isoform X7 n=1 Tax=Hibiscus syriacus TaxID=106335 RepID=UPI0019205767|nr:cylicin-1-like isoform X7 [Hibiscus syriacus]
MLTFARRRKKAMESSDKELELKLMEAGNKLLEPVSSVDELINLLDQVESFLSRVEQSPGQAMQNALSHSLKALIAEQLFRHPDDDVKVAVAACISEITRITAPEAPYLDDQMREVFKLIVSSFESLSDKSSRSYIKRTSILETVAKVRSCVVMLDLECDALIIEMFQHFLNAIRDYHADTVFTSMVTIMTLVLEESEDISMELLSPILARLKRDDEEVLPMARRLASSVLEKCASKLKPYLTQAVENSGIPFEDYSTVVASICQVAPNAVVQNDAATEKRVDVESKPTEPPLDTAIQEGKEIPKESVLTEQVDHANEKSPTSVVSYGIAQTDENNSLPDSNSLKKQEDDCFADESENVDKSTVAEPDGLEGEKVVIPDSKLEQSTKEKQGKSHSKSTEPSDSIHVDGKEVETLTGQKDDSKDDVHPPSEDPSVDGAVSNENKRQKDVQPSLTKATEDESNDVASPAPSGTIYDKSHSNKAAQPKKKDGLSKITPSVDNAFKMSSGAMSDSEDKTNKRPGKKVASAVLNKDTALVDVDKTKKESGTASDSEEKTLKQVSKKLDSSSNNAYGSSKKMGDKKKRRKLVLPEKDRTKISTSIDDEEMVDSPKAVKPNKHVSRMDEIPKTNSKRKHTQSEEKGSDTLEYDENLVGLKVKVWWPLDHAFYDGVIESFDAVIKKHKVCYEDGDVEILNLKEEKWEVIKDESESNEEVAAYRPSPDDSFEISQKKKVKAADQLVKKAKMDASPKRGGGASSRKSKGAAMKSGSKIKDGKVGGSKNVDKSDIVTKAKDHTPKTASRPVDIGSKVSSKSKIEASVDTPKSIKPKDDKPKDGDNVAKATPKPKQDTTKTTKSKQDTPKVPSHSKGKPLKIGGKSDANGGGKSKSSSTKVKESESMKENPTVPAEVVETLKRKELTSSMGPGTDPKPEKKQRKEVKATSTAES